MGLITRTQEQIDAEVAALEKIKKLVRRYPRFGGDNHEAIDAQIMVLKKVLTEEEIFDEFDNEEDPENVGVRLVVDSAMDARRWLEDEYQALEDEKPWEGGILAGAWAGTIGN